MLNTRMGPPRIVAVMRDVLAADTMLMAINYSRAISMRAVAK